MRVARPVFHAALLCLMSASAHAGFGDGSTSAEPVNLNPLHATATVVPESTSPGGTADIVVTMALDGDYHAYKEQFKIAIDSPDDLKVDKLRLTPLVKFYDTVTKKQREGITKQGTLKAAFEIPAGSKPGPQKLHARLTYQACTADHCLFPKTIALETTFTVR